MESETIKTKCRKCRRPFDSLWPFGGGLCDKCLVKKYSIAYVLKNVCGCLHSQVEELYKKLKQC